MLDFPKDWRPTRPRKIRGVLTALAVCVMVYILSTRLDSVDWKMFRMAGLDWVVRLYPLVVIGLLVFTLALVGLVVIARRRRPIRRAVARACLLWSALIGSVVTCEGFASISLAWQHRMPAFPRGLRAREALSPGSKEDVNLLVVGESSAEGVPYRDWLSVGKIVTWQLRNRIPDRMFHLEVQARAGWTLEQMHQKLAEIKKAPDAIIIYAGHNEFASRYGWFHEVRYYDDDPSNTRFSRVFDRIRANSPLARMAEEALQRERVAMRPPPSNRRLVDAPSCTAGEAEGRLADFRRRLDAIAAFCKEAGILTVLVIPPGNDAGYEPNRSVLPPSTRRDVRDAFALEVTEARRLEAVDPTEKCIARYRRLIDVQPGFAETHFRLARLLERLGDSEGAYRAYIKARDLDAHPMRFRSDFQQVYREVAARHDAILIDGPEVFRARTAGRQLDDRLFNDAFHPSFEGQVALAEAILQRMKQRHAFGWSDQEPSPVIDLIECAKHFDVTRAAWKSAADFGAGFYGIVMPIRYDAIERTLKRDRYAKAVRALAAGREAGTLGCPGIGVKPIADRLKP